MVRDQRDRAGVVGGAVVQQHGLGDPVEVPRARTARCRSRGSSAGRAELRGERGRRRPVARAASSGRSCRGTASSPRRRRRAPVTSPGLATRALSVTPPPIDRPSIATRSGSTSFSPLERLHRVDRVAGVAEPGLPAQRRRRVGPGVAAVVGVQHHEPGPREVVLLARQPLAGDVDRRLDVAVVEHHRGERAPCRRAPAGSRTPAGSPLG